MSKNRVRWVLFGLLIGGAAMLGAAPFVSQSGAVQPPAAQVRTLEPSLLQTMSATGCDTNADCGAGSRCRAGMCVEWN
jgi:hypothetical protein